MIASTITSPAVTGLLRHTLLLPVQIDHDFTPTETRLVLKHELMHLKRGDLPLNALMCVLIALHWFNPLLWIAFFKIRTDREAACDAQVLQDAPNDRRIEYGHALLKVETAFCPRGLSLGFVGIFQRGSALRERIRFIITGRPSSPAAKLVTLICIVTITFFGITRSAEPEPRKPGAQFIAIEFKIIQFDQATDWTFGGRLHAKDSHSFTTAVFSETETNEFQRQLARRQDNHLTSYPRMVTLNEREVVIRSIVNQPFEEAKGKIAYMPVGFTCKITPSIDGDDIALPTHISDSSIITHEPLVVSSRTFQSTLKAKAGSTHIIATWKEGAAKSRHPVLYLITPKVIIPEEGGLPLVPGDMLLSEGAEVEALRNATPQAYDLKKAQLGDVLLKLATEAGIHLSSLPEGHPNSRKLITFNIRASPFAMLETLCRANGLVLFLDQEIWCIRDVDDKALIGKSYALNKAGISIDTILKDIEPLLQVKDAKAEPAKQQPKPRVAFTKEGNSFYVIATQLSTPRSAPISKA